MRRKPGTLVPLEQAVCLVARALKRRGTEEFYGYLIARELEHGGSRKLTAYGTLYRALARLEQMEILTSDWEDPQVAADEGRPRRRLYSITEKGLRAAAQAETEARGSKGSNQWVEA